MSILTLYSQEKENEKIGGDRHTSLTGLVSLDYCNLPFACQPPVISTENKISRYTKGPHHWHHVCDHWQQAKVALVPHWQEVSHGDCASIADLLQSLHHARPSESTCTIVQEWCMLMLSASPLPMHRIDILCLSALRRAMSVTFIHVPTALLFNISNSSTLNTLSHFTHSPPIISPPSPIPSFTVNPECNTPRTSITAQIMLATKIVSRTRQRHQ